MKKKEQANVEREILVLKYKKFSKDKHSLHCDISDRIACVDRGCTRKKKLYTAGAKEKYINNKQVNGMCS